MTGVVCKAPLSSAADCTPGLHEPKGAPEFVNPPSRWFDEHDRERFEELPLEPFASKLISISLDS